MTFSIVLVDSLKLMLVTMLVVCEWLFGTNMFSRPIVVGLLVGIMFGRIQQGVLAGGMFEIMFLNNITLGASRPIDNISATVIGTAYIVKSDVPFVLAFLISVLFGMGYLVIDNLITKSFFPVINKKALEYAEKSEERKINRVHFYSGVLIKSIPRGIYVFLAYMITIVLVSQCLQSLAPNILHGLNISTVLFLIVGLSNAMKNSTKGFLIIYFLLGFLFSKFLQIPTFSIVLMSASIATAIILESYKGNNKEKKMEGDEDEDF